MSITVNALLFARYAELLGSDRMVMQLPEGTLAHQAVARLRQQPGAAGLPASVLIAINGRQASPDQSLAHGDELAILPPLAGG